MQQEVSEVAQLTIDAMKGRHFDNRHLGNTEIFVSLSMNLGIDSNRDENMVLNKNLFLGGGCRDNWHS